MTTKTHFLTPFVTRSHRGVYGVICRDDKILLIRKTRGPYTGLYDLPGGGPEAGETPEKTLAREIREETDCRLIRFYNQREKTIFFSDFTPASGEQGCMQHTGILFDAEIEGTPSASGDGLDSGGAIWVPVSELSSENATPFALIGAGKEMISLANEDDYPVDVGIRRTLRPQNRYAMIAAVLVFNSKGEILLHKTALNQKNEPDKWNYSAAGHVDAGESYEQAALRELSEELGIQASSLSFIGKIPSQKQGQLVAFHHVFGVKSDEEPKPDMSEISEIRFFKLTELYDLLNAQPDQFRIVVAQFLKTYQKELDVMSKIR